MCVRVGWGGCGCGYLFNPRRAKHLGPCPFAQIHPPVLPCLRPCSRAQLRLRVRLTRTSQGSNTFQALGGHFVLFCCPGYAHQGTWHCTVGAIFLSAQILSCTHLPPQHGIRQHTRIRPEAESRCGKKQLEQ